MATTPGARVSGCFRFSAPILVLLAACEPEPSPLSEWSIGALDASAAPCGVAEDSGDSASGDTIVLEPARAFCDLVAIPVATLRHSEDGSRPDPGRRIVMSSDGRFFSTAARGRQILEWTTEGEYVKAYGRTGDGPGEFTDRGGLLLFSGPADSLFVLDGGQRWTVLDPDLRFARSFQGTFNGRDAASLTVVPGRGILTTSTMSAAPSASFHWMTFEGEQGTSFGPAPSAPPRGIRLDRVSGLDPKGGFWTTPPNGEPRGMTLTQWSFEGEPMRILRRDAAWLPVGGYPPAGVSGEPALPEYGDLHVDDQGLIWVGGAFRDPRWRPIEGPGKQEMMDELYDGRMEVVDPASGRVVASFRFDGVLDASPPMSGFLGSGRSFRQVTDSLGFTALEVFELHLVGR